MTVFGTKDIALHELEYNPVLIGEGYARAVGALAPGVVEELEASLLIWLQENLAPAA